MGVGISAGVGESNKLSASDGRDVSKELVSSAVIMAAVGDSAGPGESSELSASDGRDESEELE